jgi:hypothetical protein
MNFNTVLINKKMTRQEDIENFFASAEKVIFSEPESEYDHLKGVPLVWLMLEQRKFDAYRKNGKLRKTIAEFLHGSPIFFKILQNGNDNFRISIVKKESEEEIFLHYSEVDQSIHRFINLTPENDKIFLLIGSRRNNDLIPGNEKFRNLLLILDGYSLVRV